MQLPSHEKDAVAISSGPSVSAGSPSLLSSSARKALVWGVAAAALLGLVGLVLTLPIQFPSVVNSYSHIMAANKWVLEKGSSGQLIARAFNYQTGMSDGYRVSTFENGSSVFFSLEPALKPGQHLAVGDTVGTVYSSMMQERLVALRGQLAAAEGQLAVSSSGLKSAAVEAAKQRLESAKRRRSDYQMTVVRTQALFHDYMIPPGEYERVQTTIHNLDDAIALEQTNLDAAQTGDKPEQLAVARTHIAALKDEINAIHTQAGTYTLCTPIEGVISPSFSDTVLLTILSTSHYVALLSIPWSDYALVAASPNARVSISGFSRPVRGRIVALDREVQIQSGQKVVLATALLDAPPDDLLPGSSARCSIQCRPMTAKEHAQLIARSVATSFSAPGGF